MRDPKERARLFRVYAEMLEKGETSLGCHDCGGNPDPRDMNGGVCLTCFGSGDAQEPAAFHSVIIGRLLLELKVAKVLPFEDGAAVRRLLHAMGVPSVSPVSDDEHDDEHSDCDDHPCLECTEKAHGRAEAMCGGDR